MNWAWKIHVRCVFKGEECGHWQPWGRDRDLSKWKPLCPRWNAIIPGVWNVICRELWLSLWISERQITWVTCWHPSGKGKNEATLAPICAYAVGQFLIVQKLRILGMWRPEWGWQVLLQLFPQISSSLATTQNLTLPECYQVQLLVINVPFSTSMALI